MEDRKSIDFFPNGAGLIFGLAWASQRQSIGDRKEGRAYVLLHCPSVYYYFRAFRTHSVPSKIRTERRGNFAPILISIDVIPLASWLKNEQRKVRPGWLMGKEREKRGIRKGRNTYWPSVALFARCSASTSYYLLFS